jgi:hypothetical protein
MMFTCGLRAKPGRAGFLDLLGELRNMIYELALFGSQDTEKTISQHNCPQKNRGVKYGEKKVDTQTDSDSDDTDVEVEQDKELHTNGC